MCWYCDSPITFPDPVGRSRVCPDCGKDLRSCGNCRHYLKAERGCAEPQGENPADKERANFCDWFGVNPRFREALIETLTEASAAAGGGNKARNTADAAKAAFNKLFD